MSLLYNRVIFPKVMLADDIFPHSFLYVLALAHFSYVLLPLCLSVGAEEDQKIAQRVHPHTVPPLYMRWHQNCVVLCIKVNVLTCKFTCVKVDRVGRK